MSTELKVGESVRAQFIGGKQHSQLRYPGVIEKINDDGSYHVIFGTPERRTNCFREELSYVWPVTSPLEKKALRDRKKQEPQNLKVGDNVRAQFLGGKSNAKYPAKIAKVNGDGTYAVAFGPEELRGKCPRGEISYVWPTPKRQQPPQQLKVGDNVRGSYFAGKDSEIYPAKIRSVNADGTFDIVFGKIEEREACPREEISDLMQHTTAYRRQRSHLRRQESYKESEVNLDLPLLQTVQTRLQEGKSETPYVTVTYAQSMDGSITGEKGSQLALSGPESMKMTHQLRSLHSAILVGVGTMLADDPSLTVRCGVVGSNPRPVVLDSQLRCPIERKIMARNPIIACTAEGLSDAGSEKQQRLDALKSAGAEILQCHADENERVELSDFLSKLGNAGISNLMVEGGGEIITSFIEKSLANQVVITIAPVLIGGYKPLPKQLSKRLANVEHAILGQDIIIRGDL